MLNEYEITGRARSHVFQFNEPRFAAQKEVGEAFLAMREEAKRAGFDLSPFSTFRDYHTQLRIWNNKFSGKKPLYDIDGNVRDFSKLSPPEVIDCILNWSALPGGSRHQWGTEIDVVDAAAMPHGYEPKLLPVEVRPGGIFHPLHCWLDENIEKFGFFRPYKYFKGGMYPEPWHLSYASLSMQVVKLVTPELLSRITQDAEIMGKELVLQKIPEIYTNHILNFVSPTEQLFRMNSSLPLIKEIEAAFIETVRPSQGDIAPHRCIECNQLRDDFYAFEPTNIPEDVFLKHYRDLPLLSDNAKKYFLPAWLIRAVGNPSSEAAEEVVFAFDSDHRLNPDDPFTSQQWKCIRLVLEYVASHTDEYTRQDVESTLARITNGG